MFSSEEVATNPVLAFFTYEHLAHKLQGVSKGFADMARFIMDNCPNSDQRTIALNKLLEAKDAAVRAAL